MPGLEVTRFIQPESYLDRLRAVFYFDLPDTAERTGLLGLPTLSLRDERIVRQVNGWRPLSAVIIGHQRKVYVRRFATQVICCGPYGSKLESSRLIGLDPSLQAPRREGIVARAEIVSVAIPVIRVNYDSACRRAVGSDDLAPDDEGHARLVGRCNPARRPCFCRATGYGLVPAPKPVRVDLRPTGIWRACKCCHDQDVAEAVSRFFMSSVQESPGFLPIMQNPLPNGSLQNATGG